MGFIWPHGQGKCRLQNDECRTLRIGFIRSHGFGVGRFGRGGRVGRAGGVNVPGPKALLGHMAIGEMQNEECRMQNSGQIHSDLPLLSRMEGASVLAHFKFEPPSLRLWRPRISDLRFI